MTDVIGSRRAHLSLSGEGAIIASPHRSRQSYRHEAYFWQSREDFADGLGSFVQEGLAADEPVMVAVIAEHEEWLRDSLGGQADRVEFVDMGQLGHNPARIIPGWQDFLNRHAAENRPVRGIGEPIWPGRRPEELVECQLHEALLNVAVDPQVPFWLICPYDTKRLSPAIVEEAQRSHPLVVEDHAYLGSPHYGGRAHISSLFGSELPPPINTPVAASFDEHDVKRLSAYVKLEAYVAGLSPAQAANLAAASEQLAKSSLGRGAEEVRLRLWREPEGVVCELTDDSKVDDLLIGRHVPAGEEHPGVWLANQLCDLVQVRSTSTATTMRAHIWFA
jgi:MEDS: MEthanogen/methylotroph, DcmR Sensory domain